MFVFASGICRHYYVSSDCLETPPKSLLISSLSEKILAKVSYPKNLGIENSNTKKSFHHPCHLTFGVLPLGVKSSFDNFM